MHSPANFKAAQAVVSSRLRFQRGLSRDASNGTKRPLSLREAEKRYAGSKHTTIGHIAKKLEVANTLDINEVPDPRIGRPRQLTAEEEEAIVAFVI
ncbi:hypothetical protein BFJ68_g16438 [Fusarium oxysporum]|uniref:Uncharacterized protein n=1 Tax=Fusarium oxysporum TaxID=5507 RepID=A0A420PDD1_FUSOX|nr:hypothetical protein BFJ68_g16438 [Fusarium oxysporum]